MNFSKYFDWAASSPPDEEILKKALDLSIECYGNPSAVHHEGKKARTAFENARERAANALGVKAEQVFFTSGGTESDHIPLLSVLNRESDSKGFRGRVLLSAIEHPALREQTLLLKNLGLEIDFIQPNKNGFITAESVFSKLTKDTIFVSVMAVNNETGCVQNIKSISEAITRFANEKRRPHFHVDCVQAAGKIPLDLNICGVDSIALSAHKIRGPRGIGILVLKKPIRPFLCGGGQEKNIRSGTENLFGALAFSLCLEKYFFKNDSKNLFKYDLQKSLTDDFIKKLTLIKGCTIVPSCRADFIQNEEENFSPYVIQVAFKGIPGNVMVRELDAKGFSISTGSACSAKKQSRPILAAMQVSKQEQETAVRFSFGFSTSQKSMQELLEAIKEVTEQFL